MALKPSISTTGANLTYYFTVPVTGLNTKQTILSQLIPANSLKSYRPFSFDFIFDLSTPTLGVLPSLTINIEFNGVTYPVLNNVAIAALNLSNRRFKVKGSLTAISDDASTVLLEGETRQNGGLALSTANTITAFYNDFTSVNPAIDQTFALSVQASSLLGGVNLILKRGIVGMI